MALHFHCKGKGWKGGRCEALILGRIAVEGGIWLPGLVAIRCGPVWRERISGSQEGFREFCIVEHVFHDLQIVWTKKLYSTF